MYPHVRRVERAQALLEETLSGYPAGLPTIALVDRLERWGFPEDEGLAVLHRLQESGMLRVERGRILLAE